MPLCVRAAGARTRWPVPAGREGGGSARCGAAGARSSASPTAPSASPSTASCVSGAPPADGDQGVARHDAIALLEAEHDEIGALFERYRGLGDRALAGRRKLVARIVGALGAHIFME